MTEKTLQGRRVLIAEDEYLLAELIQDEFERIGAEIAGPVPSVAAALELLASPEPIDGAVLDVNLDGEEVYAVADALQIRDVPFVFTTGYDQSVIPERYIGAPCCQKPIDAADVAQTLAEAIILLQ